MSCSVWTSPFPWARPLLQGTGVDTARSCLAVCTKHKCWQPVLWPGPFLRALNQKMYPGPIFFFFSGKSHLCNYLPTLLGAYVYLRVQSVTWFSFCVLGFLCCVFSSTIWWNIIPTSDPRSHMAMCVCVCVVWGLLHVSSTWSGKLPYFLFGNNQPRLPHWFLFPQHIYESQSFDLIISYGNS